MPTIDINAAQHQLPELLEAVRRGDSVVISRDGEPVAELVAIQSMTGIRQFGTMKGKIWIADDADAPLPDDIQAAFEGK
ncbi:type II toxin-antitoxin system Phd/YefM family antitoxin [Duganella radicis]|uniref:Type II toxin-antitoxin system prevent-host-death family antitoxin n=1 Tax=Duganella radicis TaxID=551988 RepID=A0A6L6PIX5_9BURK|nr:type II toxin-antitoxin system prevent-host-death family antitoxin [Duganella radicis]MTV38507.1 type II toxin-antitoxin system prevent-host-death family antitoxin [Duganella radicis]